MYRNMVTSLMLHGRIRTTESKAKELRRVADRVITLGKTVPPSLLEGEDQTGHQELRARRLHAFRRAKRLVNNPEALHKVFNEYAEHFKERPGGYTRIYHLGNRPGDNAPMAIIELVSDVYPSADDVSVLTQTEASSVADGAEGASGSSEE